MNCAACPEGHAYELAQGCAHRCAYTGLEIPDSKLVWGCPLEMDVWSHAGQVRARVLLMAAHRQGRAEELAALYPENIRERFVLIMRSEELAGCPIHGRGS